MTNPKDEGQEKIQPLAEKEANKLLEKEHFRKKIQEIISEYVNTVPFEEKVQRYAGKEIDKRSLSGTKYWKNIAISALITGLITTIFAIIAFYIFRVH